MPKISIVIPVYNAAKYLRESLDSVLSQTERDLEVICVDDASTDESAAILKEYAASDARVKILTEPKNVGTFAARKHGVAESTGKYLAFVDPDDKIKPTFVEKLLAAAEKQDLDIVQCGVELLEMRERTREQRKVSERYFNPHVSSYSDSLLSRAYLDRRIGWNLIFRLFRGEPTRAAFAEMPEKQAINETDALAFYYIAKRLKTFKRISDRLYVYRYGDGISTRLQYTYADCLRTLGKFDVLKEMPFKEDAAYKAMLSRMIDNSFKSAKARLKNPRERAEAWRALEEKIGARAFIEYLCERFGRNPGPIISDFDIVGFFEPRTRAEIKRIGMHYFRVSRGGVQRVMLHTARTLMALGFEVVLFIEEALDVTSFDIPEGVKLVMLPTSLGPKASASERVRALDEALRNERIDLYYTHAYSSPMLFWDLLTVNRLLKIPSIVHFHAAFSAALHYRIMPQAFERQESLMHFPDKVINLSELDAGYFRARGVSSIVIPNPMPEECLASAAKPAHDHKRKMVLWCGRNSWEKHPESAAEIFRRLKKKMPEVTTVMLKGDAVDPYYYFRRASVFLNTSETEGFSMVALEALAHGVPIVAFELNNLDLYRDNPAVFQVPQNDIDAAVEAIVSLLEREDAKELGDKAKASIKAVLDFDHRSAWLHIIDELSGRIARESVKPVSSDIAIRIREELAVGYAYRERASQWHRRNRLRAKIYRLKALVKKIPEFVRENGLRYTLLHVVDKLRGKLA